MPTACPLLHYSYEKCNFHLYFIHCFFLKQWEVLAWFLTGVSDGEKNGSQRERVLLPSPVLSINIKERKLKEKLFNNGSITHQCPFKLFHNVLHGCLRGRRYYHFRWVQWHLWRGMHSNHTFLIASLSDAFWQHGYMRDTVPLCNKGMNPTTV